MNIPEFYLRGFSSFVPEKVVTNQQMSAFVDTSDEWIVSRTGIRQRHVLDDAHNASDAGFFAAQKALKSCGLCPEDITHIFVATCTPEELCPSVACRIGGKLGVPHGVMCMDLNAACSGYLYGLEMARGVLALHPDAVVLFIATEALSRRMNYQDRSTCVLFGDGAGACVVSTRAPSSSWQQGQSPVARILDLSCKADGTASDLIIIGGGTAFQAKVGTPVDESFFLSMQGRDVYKWAVRCMVSESKLVLERQGLCLDDIDLFIAHQANQRIIEAVAQRLELPEHKVFCNVQNFGNTSAASIPLALVDAHAQGLLKPGMKVLLTAVGGGLTWGAGLLQC